MLVGNCTLREGLALVDQVMPHVDQTCENRALEMKIAADTFSRYSFQHP